GVFVKVFDLVEIFLVLVLVFDVVLGVRLVNVFLYVNIIIFDLGVLVNVTLGNVDVFVLGVLGVLRGVLALGTINVTVGVLGVLGNVGVLGSKRTARSTRNRRQRMISVRPRLQRIGLVLRCRVFLSVLVLRRRLHNRLVLHTAHSLVRSPQSAYSGRTTRLGVRTLNSGRGRHRSARRRRQRAVTNVINHRRQVSGIMATATTVTTPTLGQTGSVFTLTTLAFILLGSLQLRQTLILGHKTIEQVADTGLLRV